MLWSDLFASNREKYTGYTVWCKFWKDRFHFDFPCDWKIAFSWNQIWQKTKVWVSQIFASTWPFELCPTLVQSVAKLPPTGEALKILARELGNRVYTKYCVRQKQKNQMVEKLGNIYNAFTDVLAKDTKVEKTSCYSCLPLLLQKRMDLISIYLNKTCFHFFCTHCGATQ